MIIAYAITIVLIAIRVWMGFNVTPEHASLEGVYKALAHCFVGGLAVLWWQAKYRPGRIPNQMAVKLHKTQVRNFGIVFWGLCIVEVSVAIASRVL